MRFILSLDLFSKSSKEMILRVKLFPDLILLSHLLPWIPRTVSSGISSIALCDNKGPTVVLVKAKNGRIACGYSCVSWKSGGGVRENNPNGFLCAIDTNHLSLELFKGVSGECNIYQQIKYGPFYSYGFYILDNCDKNLDSSSSLGTGFESKGDPFALFGTQNFTVVECEVYGLSLSTSLV
jgi:hypothetical protein